MFDSLTKKFSSIFTNLKSKGLLSEDDINQAMREIRLALLEADVALPVVKEFIKNVKEKALGQEVIKSISPGQLIVKIVQDELTNILSSPEKEQALNLSKSSIFLMLGLQGSGKTTSTAKLALKLQKENKNVLVASLDIYRPAAQEQLAILARDNNIDCLKIITDQTVMQITKRAVEKFKNDNYDVLILDSAGRLHIDQELIAELQEVANYTKPQEQLLVVDSLTGQDAANIAKNFCAALNVTGTILTRLDGDSRGGAALSMRYITEKPIKFIGTGEKVSDFEYFHAERMASRLLDMGDIVSLVEKAQESINQDDAEKLTKRIKSGKFNFNDLLSQLNQIDKLGGMGGLMNLIPGISKFKDQINQAGMDSKLINRQKAIIYSMTKKERLKPDLLNGSRKRRIAQGSGMTVQDVNRLLKQFKQMQTMFKKMKNMKNKSMLQSMASRFLS